MIIPPFKLSVYIKNKNYTFQVGQTQLTASKEVFTLIHKHRIIEIQSNRPFIRKDPNSKKKINWKSINAKVEHKESIELITQELEKHIHNIEKPPFDWSTHPKNAGVKPYEPTALVRGTRNNS